MHRLGDRPLLADLVGRANAFDPIRLGAACLVVVFHSFLLTRTTDPLQAVDPNLTLGTLGVSIFFAISGFLITASWIRRPQLRRFVLSRTLRIIPALAVVVFAAAFVIGPLVTRLPLPRYLASPETWEYASGNLLFDFRTDLPGVFTALPHASTVNGSLWTLAVEVKAYAIVAGLGCAGLLGARRGRWFVVAVGVGLLGLTVNSLPDGFGPLHRLLDGLGGEAAVNYLAVFMFGSALYLFRDSIRVDRWAIAVALVMVVVALPTSFRFVAIAVCLPYAVVGGAYLVGGLTNRLDFSIDASYGTYLWAFPLQQLLVGAFAPTAVGLAVISLPLALAAGVGSFVFVERGALGLRDHRLAQRLLASSSAG